MDKYDTYRRNQIDRGFKIVRVWVPSYQVEQLKKYAQRLRNAHTKKGEK